MFLTLADLTPFDPDIDPDRADLMIEDAENQATLLAPCIATLDPVADSVKYGAVKAILRQAVLRWEEVGAGGVTTTQQGAGPFQQMTTTTSRASKGAFWPSEIQRLQSICADSIGRAFEVDTMPAGAGAGRHGRWITTTDWIPL